MQFKLFFIKANPSVFTKTNSFNHHLEITMAYVLEKITQADQEKILKDAECDEKKRRLLIYARDHADFPETWAIDYQRNCYMLVAPIIVRSDEIGGAIFFYFKGFLFEIRIESVFGNQIRCVDKLDSSLFSEFRTEVTAAFGVFGRGGRGPLNEFGIPEFSITPDIKLEG